MICVFDVIDGPARGRRFWLRENQRIAVGRISTADFSVPSDSHMSRHHLIIESNVQVIRIRDVGSANGTFVNDSRISNLELCAGDKVRAGSTTFEVSVLADDEDPHKSDGIPLDTFSAAAATSFATAGVSATNQVVRPSTSDNRPISKRVVHHETSATQPVVANSGSPSLTDDAMTMRSEPLWWTPYFQLSPVPSVLVERPDFSQLRCDMVDVIKRARSVSELALVVNEAQLGGAMAQIFETSINPKLLTRLSRTLSLIQCDGSDNVWTFARLALKQDAFICVAPVRSFGPGSLDEVLDCMSYPSMLAGLLDSPDGKVRQRLLTHLKFALFEKNRAGELCLMLGEL